ncbi:WbqC family protein [Cesiribacter andamanensis]|uniref:WbqC-like protein family protein n=1 Tax=Cesiribacter andamanensis AMV16 TaxID=1279009 RepID=M7P0G1_9BACT|nr:WbqC family protein [Cesiribacter andamanensis]EMR04089.1 WbqC-like protein family protein [Cesiribacter andamanensis AMV16]
MQHPHVSALLALHYFPCLEYFTLFTQPGQVLLEAYEHYVKQSYRNRCYILGPHQVEKLTVPVLGGSRKMSIREVEIDNRQPWQRQHWRALQSCYGKAPFWEHYAPRLQPLFDGPWQYLWELNEKVLTLCLQILQLPATPVPTDAYKQTTGSGLTDLRQALRPGIPFTARDLYRPQPYTQLFGATFVANLSVLDVLFCEGPAAAAVIRQSAQQK